jgi:DHA1 family tetracycline resistance protein-like MFS transporter
MSPPAGEPAPIANSLSSDEPRHGPRKAAVAFIFITVTLDMLALGMIIPVLPKLVESFVEGDTARAAAIYGIFGTAWALMQFLFSPLLGALSDRFGRRPIILLSNLGLGLDYILMALAPNLIWLLVGRIVSGIAAATISTAFAYIADVTPAEKRAQAFGMVGAAFGIGFIIGPAFGGLLGSVDPRLPFWVAAGCSLANACYGWLVLPESLPPEKRAPFRWRRANPVGSLVLLRSHPELFALAGAQLAVHIAHAVLPAVFVLYAGYRFDWDEFRVGLMLALVGACSMIVQAGLLGRFVRWFGERKTLVIGLLSGAVGFVIYAFAPNGIAFLIGVPAMALWGLGSPAMQGLMSRRVHPTEQGQLQGANSSIMAVGALLGPFLFTQTFAYAIGAGRGWHLPGAPFLLAALLMLLAAALGWHATRPREVTHPA